MSINVDDDGYAQSFPAGAISGRKVPTSTGRQGVLGTVRVLPEATQDALALARRNLREIDDADLTWLDARHFQDADGQVWRIPHGATNLYDVTAAQAFTVRDDLIVPLQRAEQADEQVTTPIGEMRARVIT